MSPDEAKALKPTLDRAKTTLKTALETACATDLDRADTGELIRIEEVLAIANEAAKEAVSVRRRLHKPREIEPTGTRDVQDARGVRWSVFAVHPSAASGGRAPLREHFRDGWLAFDAGDETRRIAPIPTDWRALSDADLLTLCEQAEPAPRRPRPSGGGDSP
ncbi:MAG TPA: hypothetical protein VN600_02750 [Gemmatimonadaceae bacterium]|nr:hypothetical protein [Gemmatimonadaceae bacterium]